MPVDISFSNYIFTHLTHSVNRFETTVQLCASILEIAVPQEESNVIVLTKDFDGNVSEIRHRITFPNLTSNHNSILQYILAIFFRYRDKGTTLGQ